MRSTVREVKEAENSDEGEDEGLKTEGGGHKGNEQEEQNEHRSRRRRRKEGAEGEVWDGRADGEWMSWRSTLLVGS
jgi:hypothetical protein